MGGEQGFRVRGSGCGGDIRHLPLGAPAQVLMAPRNPRERHNVLVDGQHIGHGLVLHEDPWFVLPGNAQAYTVTDGLSGAFIASDANPAKAVSHAYRRLLRHAQDGDRLPGGGVDRDAILDRARARLQGPEVQA